MSWQSLFSKAVGPWKLCAGTFLMLTRASATINWLDDFMNIPPIMQKPEGQHPLWCAYFCVMLINSSACWFPSGWSQFTKHFTTKHFRCMFLHAMHEKSAKNFLIFVVTVWQQLKMVNVYSMNVQYCMTGSVKVCQYQPFFLWDWLCVFYTCVPYIVSVYSHYINVRGDEEPNICCEWGCTNNQSTAIKAICKGTSEQQSKQNVAFPCWQWVGAWTISQWALNSCSCFEINAHCWSLCTCVFDQ